MWSTAPDPNIWSDQFIVLNPLKTISVKDKIFIDFHFIFQ